MNLRRLASLPLVALLYLLCAANQGCDETSHPNSDEVQKAQQERILQEGTSSVGMPAVKNFREKRLLKQIIEMRDQEQLLTYSYTYSEQTGKFYFYCNSIGYPLPYATEFTNPQKIAESGYNIGYAVTAQADPNGLFSPASADGTWVLCLHDKKAAVTYVEPKVTTLPFLLPQAIGNPAQ